MLRGGQFIKMRQGPAEVLPNGTRPEEEDRGVSKIPLEFYGGEQRRRGAENEGEGEGSMKLSKIARCREGEQNGSRVKKPAFNFSINEKITRRNRKRELGGYVGVRGGRRIAHQRKGLFHHRQGRREETSAAFRNWQRGGKTTV